MSSIVLTNFKNSYSDFLRANRYIFSIEEESWTDALSWQEEFEFMCKSASIPARTVGETTLNWQGQSYKIPTDNSYEDFTVTFLNDDTFKLKNYFEDWMERIVKVESNTRNTHNTLKATLVVSQINGLGEILKIYKMVFAHPTNVGSIELDYETNDTIQTFQVTFSYSYFTVENMEEISEPEQAVPTKTTQDPKQYSVRDGSKPTKPTKI